RLSPEDPTIPYTHCVDSLSLSARSCELSTCSGSPGRCQGAAVAQETVAIRAETDDVTSSWLTRFRTPVWGIERSHCWREGIAMAWRAPRSLNTFCREILPLLHEENCGERLLQTVAQIVET